MTWDELVETCEQYCDACEVYVYMHYKMNNEMRLMSIQNFGVNKTTEGQLLNMLNYTDRIEYVEIRPEEQRIPWSEITDIPTK